MMGDLLIKQSSEWVFSKPARMERESNRVTAISGYVFFNERIGRRLECSAVQCAVDLVHGLQEGRDWDR